MVLLSNGTGVATGLFFLLTLLFVWLAIRARLRARDAGGTTMPSRSAAPDQATRRWRLGALIRPSNPLELDKLQRRLAAAGLYGADAVDQFLSARLGMLIGALCCFIAIIPFIHIPILVLLLFLTALGAALVLPGFWVDARARQRQSEVTRTLPGILDLLVTCLEAGLNLEQALTRVVDAESAQAENLLALELNTALAEIRAGLPLEAAFRKLAYRIGLEEMNTLAVLISRAATLGANMAELLREHNKAMRESRMLMLEEKAGRANAKLTLPLALCLLPSVMVLLLGPAVIAIMRSF